MQTASKQPIGFQGADHEPDAPALDIRDLSVTYSSSGTAVGNHKALLEITCTLAAGEQIAIIGPNGAGKSTLLKLIAGIVKPDKGSVLMYGAAPDKHICIAYVPQRSQIDWTFPVTVSDVVMMGRTRQIGFFRRPGRYDRDRVRKSLERVNAWHLAEKQIGELSGGQQQRVFIARALALETDLLLLDEPLSGLDMPSQTAIFDILASLRQEQVSVLMATHDLNLAGERFDRVMLLNQRIIALGPAQTVFTTENLLAAYGGQPQVVAGDARST